MVNYSGEKNNDDRDEADYYYGIGIRNRVFHRFDRLFLPGTSKMSPAPSMSYWSIFERNLLLVGLADFAGSKFQRMANWPSFDFFIEAG